MCNFAATNGGNTALRPSDDTTHAPSRSTKSMLLAAKASRHAVGLTTIAYRDAITSGSRCHPLTHSDPVNRRERERTGKWV